MSVTVNGTSGLVFGDGTIQGTAAGMPFRNRVINGDMRIDQRNNGASVTVVRGANGVFTTDRWSVFNGGVNNGNVTVNQDGVSSPTGNGFVNSLKIVTSTAGAAAAADNFSFFQPIEGLNVSDLAWGTSAAQTVTLSFYVRCSQTGTYAASVRNGAANRSYVGAFTINSANTWEYKTITIPGDQTGTWLTTNGVGIYLSFALGVGSNFQTSAGSWQAGNFFAVTGQTNLCTVANATFQITGVQLEKAAAATSFEFRPYATELTMCQRYFVFKGTLSGGYTLSLGQGLSNGGTGVWRCRIPVPVTMRSTPSITYTNLSLWNPNGSLQSLSSLQTIYGLNGLDIEVDTVAGGTVIASGYPVNIQTNGTGGASWLKLEAEL